MSEPLLVKYKRCIAELERINQELEKGSSYSLLRQNDTIKAENQRLHKLWLESERKLAEEQVEKQRLRDSLGWHQMQEDELPPANVWLLYRRDDGFGVSFTIGMFIDEDGRRSIPTFATHWRYADVPAITSTTGG